ncbi:peroxiredoxin [Sphingomicrobium astaxanthinifaciens]|uniref:peroxiredoxin n=1 Tax=Sphingomicrobium astaxanthinifaciens TaxID=1227949 RepID=UPI001FCB2B46|nr:peroxiredoxin [Sphingomicrobium astaxanthinifaciens]MCJ7421664.1 peroxiredoxin [Sphingomicrobium astaxanthinifaciens]
MLKPGDKAPVIKVTTGTGEVIDLAAPGGKLVVYFYPKDNTPGCTKQAIAFSEQLDAFAAAGARVIGVSRDPVASHERFTAKHDLTVPLVADEDGAISDAFGTWGEKKNYGRTYMGMIRSTFLIGADGTILEAWPNVRVKGHVEKVLEAVEAA